MAARRIGPRDLAETLAARSLREPPDGVLRRAIALGSELPAKTGAVQWIIERLFDSALEPLPVGVRSAGSSERRLLYEARPSGEGEKRQVDLRLRRVADGGFELTGQCVPPLPGARVEVQAGRARKRETCGPSGEFLVRDLPAGSASLSLSIVGDDGAPLVIGDIPAPAAP